ncbi:MAG: DUF58 domain-containing protein [Bdellovibrio sp.]|nr:MAG: DUF58 domain-containing protein [Bdellovibrio sp.]
MDTRGSVEVPKAPTWSFAAHAFPSEVLQKVKLLEIRTRKLVNNLFSGEYHTVFKGQGMTFSDFREYVPGDDIRAISWTLTARAGKPFIKKFDEERELTVFIVVDISRSTDFGSNELLKGEAMTHLAALVAFSAVRNKDQVGLLLFSDIIEHFVPAKKGRGHTQRLLRDLYYFKPRGKKTRIAQAANHLLGVLKKRSVIFFMSDFIDSEFSAEPLKAATWAESLRLLGRKHDVVAVVVRDRAELELPDVGLVEIQDPETDEVLTIDTSSRAFRESYAAELRRRRDLRDRLLRQAQVDRVEVDSAGSYVNPLVQFFERRRGRS